MLKDLIHERSRMRFTEYNDRPEINYKEQNHKLESVQELRILEIILPLQDPFIFLTISSQTSSLKHFYSKL